MRYIGKPLPAAASQRFPGALANQHRAGCDALIAGSEALNLARVHLEAHQLLESA